IRDLESVLGTPVAERSNRQVLMTRVGARVAERARVLLRDADEIMEVAKAGRDPMTGEIRLGVIPTIAPFLLPRVLPVLRERYPALTLYLREEQTAPLLARLEGGELEAALIALPYDTDGLRIETIMEDEFLFACGPAHALAGRDEVPVKALEGEALLLLEEGHCLRGHALEVCGVGDKRARAQFEASSLHTLVQMVAAGIGITLVPRLAVEARILEGTRISLARLDAPASRRIGLAWRRRSGRTEDFQSLAGALRELSDTA
ncbi:MAG: LysR substrate-binding domain-containing protein, partial [Gammaproteobacteria bacterium]|nr:LysR substrate-binding domain-containing protein [Gammaproteobacteria bacterium]